MDVEQSNRASQAFRDSSRAAISTHLVITSPFTITGAVLGSFELGRIIVAFVIESLWFRGTVGLCLAAVAIRSFVFWLNGRHAQRPPDAP